MRLLGPPHARFEVFCLLWPRGGELRPKRSEMRLVILLEPQRAKRPSPLELSHLRLRRRLLRGGGRRLRAPRLLPVVALVEPRRVLAEGYRPRLASEVGLCQHERCEFAAARAYMKVPVELR